MNRSTERALAMIGLIILSIPTALAFTQNGLAGFVDGITHSWATIQIYIDLVIAMVFIVIWVWRDAKDSGRNPWPWIIASFIVGSFAPLVYLLIRHPKDS
ncbi:MAG: DUF2834 domain-containing protein [Chloroflexota bacterium]